MRSYYLLAIRDRGMLDSCVSIAGEHFEVNQEFFWLAIPGDENSKV